MIKCASVFSDNMVLQREKPVRIFGVCSGSSGVTVSIPELSVSVRAVIRGERWEAVLPPMPAFPSCSVLVESGEEKITFSNVALGEVWIAGGQSNMEFELHSDKNGAEELAKCAGENVRYYYTPKCEMNDEKLLEMEAVTGWNLPSQEGSRAWSAVGYYFAKELSRTLGVTVGVLGCNWGGTSASAWMSRDYLERDSRLIPYLEDYDRATAGKSREEMIREYDEYLAYHADWERKMQELYAQRPDVKWAEVLEICGENRYPGPMGVKNPMRPCGLYDTMVSRVAPYSARGVLWYQGESDDHRPAAYYPLLCTMIECWRDTFRDDELPFMIVQLPMFRYAEDPDYKHWCLIREAQEKVFRTVRNTGLAPALDCGEFNNIHPTDKTQVGHRLYLQAMSQVYGLFGEHMTMAPSYSHHTLDGGKLTVSFRNYSPVCELRSREGWTEDFELSGADAQWYPAEEGTIHGEQITLSSSKVPEPENLRYLWTNYSEVRLFGENGLPVLPFRTCAQESGSFAGTAIRTTDGGASSV